MKKFLIAAYAIAAAAVIGLVLSPTLFASMRQGVSNQFVFDFARFESVQMGLSWLSQVLIAGLAIMFGSGAIAKSLDKPGTFLKVFWATFLTMPLGLVTTFETFDENRHSLQLIGSVWLNLGVPLLVTSFLSAFAVGIAAFALGIALSPKRSDRERERGVSIINFMQLFQ